VDVLEIAVESSDDSPRKRPASLCKGPSPGENDGIEEEEEVKQNEKDDTTHDSADRFGNVMSNVVDVEDDEANDLIEEQVTPQPSVSSSNPRLLNPFHRYNIADINDDGGNRSREEEGYYYKVVPKSNDRGPPDAVSRVNGRVKQPSLTSVVDTLTRLSPKAPAVGESANEDGVASLPLDPEKLAYILIGVCCGLSLLCLVLVAVSIGYKSETHYRLENGSLNASGSKSGKSSRGSRSARSGGSSSDTSASGATSQSEDEIHDSTLRRLSADELSSGNNMKLGPWFNGKPNMTLERSANEGSAGESTSKAKKAFPTSVYLDKLAGSDEITSPERRISTNSDDIFGEVSNGVNDCVYPGNEFVCSRRGGQRRRQRRPSFDHRPSCPLQEGSGGRPERS